MELYWIDLDRWILIDAADVFFSYHCFDLPEQQTIRDLAMAGF